MSEYMRRVPPGGGPSLLELARKQLREQMESADADLFAEVVKWKEDLKIEVRVRITSSSRKDLADSLIGLRTSKVLIPVTRITPYILRTDAMLE